MSLHLSFVGFTRFCFLPCFCFLGAQHFVLQNRRVAEHFVKQNRRKNAFLQRTKYIFARVFIVYKKNEEKLQKL